MLNVNALSIVYAIGFNFKPQKTKNTNQFKIKSNILYGCARALNSFYIVLVFQIQNLSQRSIFLWLLSSVRIERKRNREIYVKRMEPFNDTSQKSRYSSSRNDSNKFSLHRTMDIFFFIIFALLCFDLICFNETKTL